MNTILPLAASVQMRLRISGGKLRRGQVAVCAGVDDSVSDMVGRYCCDELDGSVEAGNLALRCQSFEAFKLTVM